jgi:oligopeptide/dipeptide ABC transporter ATP-binding protein
MAEPLLAVDDLSVVFPMPLGDVHAVNRVTFEIQPGQIYGIVGESGCGKTATGRAILQLVPPPGKITGGRILFRGEDLINKNKQEMRLLRGRRIAMVFQDPAAALNPVFTIGQQLLGIMKHHKIAYDNGRRQRAIELLGELGLPAPESILNRYPHELSGGMQQRAMIAMALSTEPDLIIADEPTSALDVTIQSQILDLLVRLRDERAVTIILITHDLGVVAETCDEVAVFYLGEIIERGTARDIFHRTKHPYTQQLLAALPNPRTWGSDLKVIPGSVPTNLEQVRGCPFESRCSERVEICKTAQPLITEFSDSHQTVCHLYRGGKE